jgi:hypothetical protein
MQVTGKPLVQLTGLAAQSYLDRLEVPDYLLALESSAAVITPSQRAMLAGHANAVWELATYQDLVVFGNCDDSEAAASAYGRLASHFAKHFGVSELKSRLQAIAVLCGRWLPASERQWRLREPLVEALRTLGWIEPLESSPVDAVQEVDDDPQSRDVSSTVRQALVNARVGQGSFRTRMLRLREHRCALTGCAVESVLVASHAKAWKDSSNDERLDEFNGLPLAASVDRLFDQGLIAFADDGALLLGKGLDWPVLAGLGVAVNARLRKVHPQNIGYLSAHRRRFGFEG